MPSEPIRDPVKGPLLTPPSAALVIIGYQPVQVNSIASMDRQLLVNKATVRQFMDIFIQTGGTTGIQFSYDKVE
jgi:hypothetical protein